MINIEIINLVNYPVLNIQDILRRNYKNNVFTFFICIGWFNHRDYLTLPMKFDGLDPVNNWAATGINGADLLNTKFFRDTPSFNKVLRTYFGTSYEVTDPKLMTRVASSPITKAVAMKKEDMNVDLITRESPPCIYCTRAKALLKSHKIPYREQTIGKDIEVNQVKEMFPAAQTLPIIVINGKYIGGFTQLSFFLENNK